MKEPTHMKTVLAFSGSLSSNSINQKLIAYSAPLLTGVEVRVISLRDFALPLYSRDVENEGIPSDVTRLRSLFDAADGFLLSVPEYNSSLPAAFKNTVDWLSRLEGKPFQDKPVLLMSATPGGRGGASVQQHLLRVLPFWGAKVAGHFSLPKFNDNFVEGELDSTFHTPLMDALLALRDALNN